MRTLRFDSGDEIAVDDTDFWWLSKYRWTPLNAKWTTYAKTHVEINGASRTVPMHSLILPVAIGMVVDHRDHDGLNNVRSNLRPATRRQNKAYSRPFSNTGFKGVSRTPSGRFVVNCDNRRIGYFEDAIEAAKTYDAAAKVAFGDFAWLNFPPATGLKARLLEMR